MKDYRNLLSITPQKPSGHKNILEVWTEWDSNDADYVEHSSFESPEILFGNKKLIYCLAYISLDYDFKGHESDSAVFNQYVFENRDIDNLENIIFRNGFGCSTENGHCHTCCELSITYYDDNGKPFDIGFEDIHERWKGMTYEEICKEINDIEEE